MGRALLGALLGVTIAVLLMSTLLLGGAVWYLANPEAAKKSLPFLAQQQPEPAEAAAPEPLIPAAQPQLVATPTPIRDGEVQPTGGMTRPLQSVLMAIPAYQEEFSIELQNPDTQTPKRWLQIPNPNKPTFFVKDLALFKQMQFEIAGIEEDMKIGQADLQFVEDGNNKFHKLKVDSPLPSEGELEVTNNGMRLGQILLLTGSASTSLITDPTSPIESDGPTQSLKVETGLTHGFPVEVTWRPKDGDVVSQHKYPTANLVNENGKSTIAGVAIPRVGQFKIQVAYEGVPESTVESDIRVYSKSNWDLVTKAVQFQHPASGTQETFVIPVESNHIPLHSSDLTVQLEKQDFDRDILLKEGKDTEAEESVASGDQSVLFENIQSGKRSLFIQDKWSQKKSGPILVHVPKDGPNPPQFLRYANNLYPEQLAAIPGDDTVEVHNGYLHLEGSAYGADRVELHVFKSVDGEFHFEDAIKVEVGSDQFWASTASLPVDETARRIFAIGFAQGSHAYSSKVLKINSHQSSLPSGELLKTIQVNGNEAKDGRYVSSSAEITISAIAGKYADARLVAIVGGEVVKSGGTVTPEEANEDKYELKIPNLKPGVNTEVRLALVQGNKRSQEQAIRVIVLAQGPSVVGVVPRNFGTADGQYTLVVTFDADHPLESENAGYRFNYVLVDKKGNGTGTVTPEFADFDPQTNSVRLRFVKDNEPTIHPMVYQLRINSRATGFSPVFGITSTQDNNSKIGIKDIYGNPLGKTADAPNGDDYEDVLDGTTGSTPASGQTALPPQMALSEITVEEPYLLTRHVGLPAVTGPPVDYKEFTEPRESTNGFNPSDKVVTRVARLYYNRDAHRVVQVINRRAKSYNAQNATMSRQLADQARLFAEQTVDRRRESERRAIASAQRARQAEKRAQEARQQLTSTESRLTDLNQLVIRQQGLVESLEAQIAGTVEQQPSTDTRPLQVRLNDAEVMLSQLQAQRNKLQSDMTLLQETFATANASVEAYREREIEEREYAEREQAKEDRAIDHQFRLETAAADEDPDTYVPGQPKSDDPVAQVSISVIGEGLIQLRGPLKGVNIVRTMINQMDSPVGQVRIGVHTVQVNGEDGDKMEEAVGRIQRYVDHSRFLTSQSAQMLRKAVVLVASRKAESVNGICEEGVPIDVNLHGPIDLGITKASHVELGAECPPNVIQPGTQAWRNLKYQDAFFGKDFMDELREMDSEFLRSGNKILSLHSMDTTSLASALFLLALASNETRLEILQEFQRMLECNLPVDEFEYFDASDSKLRYHFKKFQFMADNARFVSFRGFFNDQVIGDDTLNPAQREFIRLAQILKSRLVTEIELKQRIVERALIEERIGDYQVELKRAKKIEENARAALQEALRVRRTTQIEVVSILSDAISEISVVFDDVKIPIEIAATSTTTSNSGSSIQLCALTATQRQRMSQLNQQKLQLFSSKIPDGFQGQAELRDRLRDDFESQFRELNLLLASMTDVNASTTTNFREWLRIRKSILNFDPKDPTLRNRLVLAFSDVDDAFRNLIKEDVKTTIASQVAKESRRPLDHKKFLDMLIDETEEKFIELVEGTRAQTAVIDDYVKRIATSLEDDFNTQFYEPAFRNIRKQTYSCWAVDFGQIEHTTVLTNNRQFAKVLPQATMEFDLPKRELAITEAMQAAQAAYNDYGALITDPNFLALTKLYSGQPASAVFNNGGPTPLVRDVLPGLSSQTDEELLIQGAPRQPQFESQLEALIPDPAVYKFETGTGYEIRPVIQPDGQSVVFKFNYMYTTNIREPVRADEKHLGRVKRHFVNTDVQLSNYELREVSRYRVALKANRTSRGVPLLEDIPVAGALFRPLPQAESSLQQNVILAHSVIYPTLFDLMGLRWAPAVADVDVHRLQEEEFVYRNRMKSLKSEVYDYSSTQVDEFLRLPQGERRPDLYRPQEEIPWTHPNGYSGPGNNQEDSTLQEVPAIQNFNPGPGMSAPLIPVDPQTSNDQPLFVPPKLEQEPDAGRTVVPSSFSKGQLQSTPDPTLMAPPRTSRFSNSATDLPARGSRPISTKNAIRRVSFTTSPKAKSMVTADLPTPRKSQPQKRWAFPLLSK